MLMEEEEEEVDVDVMRALEFAYTARAHWLPLRRRCGGRRRRLFGAGLKPKREVCTFFVVCPHSRL